MKLSELKDASYNPRSIDEKSFEGLEYSLSEFGDISGITYNMKTGNLVCGHQRKKAIIDKYGDGELQFLSDDYEVVGDIEKAAMGYFKGSDGNEFAVRLVNWSVSKEKAANLAANNPRLSGKFTPGIIPIIAELKLEMPEQVEILQLDEIEIEPLPDINFEAESELDNIPDISESDPIIKRGDFFRLGKHYLLCGDSTQPGDVEKVMNDEEADLLFTSPPYSNMRTYDKGTNVDIDYLVEFIPTFYPFAKYQVINLGLKYKDNEIVEYWQAYIKKAKQSGYKFLSWNVWNQQEAGSIYQQKKIFSIFHEWIFVFGKENRILNYTVPKKDTSKEREKYKGGLKRQADGNLKRITRGELRDFKQLGTVQSIYPQKARNVDSTHSAVFPVELPFEYIRAMTDENELVIDPFIGSGTTLIACEKLNRRCRGIEISPKYCEVIIKRWFDTFINDDFEHVNGNLKLKEIVNNGSNT